MFPFTAVFETPKEHTQGSNTCTFEIVHHTATKEGTDQGVLDGLNKREDFASCHFMIGSNGEIYKIGDPRDILWHAGQSQWGTKTDLNKYSIGFEIIGPWSTGGFSRAQRRAIRLLLGHVSAAFSIAKENILRHRDITGTGSPNMRLAIPGDKCRKIDPDDSLWSLDGYASFDAWRKSIKTMQINEAFDQSAKRMGIWNGERPNDMPKRAEVGKMLSRSSGKEESAIWNGLNPDNFVMKEELEVMTERAFGYPYIGIPNRKTFAGYCYISGLPL